LGAVLAYKFINPKGGYGIPKRTAALGNGRGPYAHRFNPIEPFFTNYGGGLYMISGILQEEIYPVLKWSYKDLTLASINGIIHELIYRKH
jgi:hypothetical protein